MATGLLDNFGDSNPLDLVEEILSVNEWNFDRSSNDELVVDCGGRMGAYQLHFAWSAEVSAMHFSCFTDLRVPPQRRPPVYELLATINGRMWLGHFDLASGDESPTFRHAVLLRGAHGASVEQLEDMVDHALAECERYYTAFQFVIWGGKDPTEAVAASLLDPVGEA